MSGKLYKAILAGAAAVLLFGASQLQWRLTRERDHLGLNAYTELKGAPPVLALTTVALGGFRGLISNALWIRASELQEQDKYFEMVQLADWITKLEPHFTQVWLMQGWNMAFNISIKFKDDEDRWRWVERGISLLRDEGLTYNPFDVLIHRELAWFFQFKMGGNMDDAHMYYKLAWANQMEKVFGKSKPDWEELIHPTTDDAKRRVAILTDKLKMHPEFMKQLDELYGPLEWRLPEASAIYWAAEGMEAAKKNERKINPDDIMTLRRVIYQSMQLACLRGRLIRVGAGQADRVVDFGPNLVLVPKVNLAYEKEMEADPKNADHIGIAHRNFLLDAIYFLHVNNQKAAAQQWYAYLAQKYPDKPMLENIPNSLPRDLTVDEYAIARVQQEVGSLSHDKTKVVLEGLETRALFCFATDQTDELQGLEALALQIWNRYQEKTRGAEIRLRMPPLAEIRQDVLQRLLHSEPPLAPEIMAKLAPLAGPTTNAPATTNAPVTVPK